MQKITLPSVSLELSDRLAAGLVDAAARAKAESPEEYLLSVLKPVVASALEDYAREMETRGAAPETDPESVSFIVER